MLFRLVIFMGCAPTLLFAQFGGGLGTQPQVPRSQWPLANSAQFQLQAPSENILDALKQNVEVDFFETPLQDIADFIAQQYEIQVKLDIAALAEMGLAEDQPITYTVQGVSLANFLDRALRQHDLDYVVDGPLMILTSPDVANVSMETKVFDVGDLLIGDFDEQRLEDAIRSLTVSGDWVSIAGEGGVLQITNGQLIVVQTQRGLRAIESFLQQLRESKEAQHEFADKVIVVAYPLQPPKTGHLGDQLSESKESVDPFAERMAKIIPELIAPDSWSEKTRVEILPGMLVIVQTREVQSAIKRFLEPVKPAESAMPGGAGSGFF